jgi:hypothetical protein
MVLFLGLSFLACDKEKGSGSQDVSNPELESLNRIPAGSAVKEWIYVEQSNWLPVLDDISVEISQCARAVEEGNCKMATAEFRKLALLLKAQKTSGNRLNRSIAKLEKTAGKISGNYIKTHKQTLNNMLILCYFADLSDRYVPEHPDYWRFLQDEPEIYFNSAREFFKAGEKIKAAVDLRRSLVFLKMEAVRAGQKAKDQLFAAVHGISQLAASVEKSGAITPEVFDRYLSRGHQALAASHSFLARKNLDEKHPEIAEIEYQASMLNLRCAGTLSNYKISSTLEKLSRRVETWKNGPANRKARRTFEKSLDLMGETLTDLDKKTAPPG